MELNVFFEQNPTVALAFSGGVDSSYLLYAALSHGADVRPYYVKTAFQPDFELADAQRLAEALGVLLTVLELDILSVENVKANPPERCYYCKHQIFSTIQERAAADGYHVLIDGTNASDDTDERPGMRALTERSVRSPLREAGLTKDDVRARSKAAGLFTWNKPAYACLATRITAGFPIDAANLHKIEQAEDRLFALGFTDFRVRVFHDAARLQVPAAQFARAVEKRAEISAALKDDFPTILLDLETR